ncbi:MAG: response regulator [Anaerolineae bacterium]|nr:response regulator [Anaerolineae bacterium]
MAKPREDDLLRNLRLTFRAEAAEHLQTLNRILLQLERTPDAAAGRPLLQEALGAAHTLKGAAQAVEFDEIARLVHAVESAMQAMGQREEPPGAAVYDLLYDALDTVERALGGQMVATDLLYDRLAAAAGAGAEPADAGVRDELPALDGTAPVTPGEETIRVSVRKLDDLMAQAGELLVSKLSAEQRRQDVQGIHHRLAQWPKTWRIIKTLLPHLDGEAGRQLTELLADLNDELSRLTEAINVLDYAIGHDTLRLGMVTAGLQDEARRVRMVPFQTLALGLQRAVRDAAHDEDKNVTLRITGGEVELDKQVLETLKDPLLHLLRNAVGHGIEPPDERARAGKPAQGDILLAVCQRGGEIHLTVQDDGRGFDLERLRAAAHAREDIAPDAHISDDELIELAFMPGVSTASQVTGVSGRGIGLDVVRQRLHNLQGRVRVESEPGKGATFYVVVPVSLSVTHALLVKVGQEIFALPLLAVEQIHKPRKQFTVEGRWMLEINGARLPMVPLAGILKRPLNGGGQTGEPLVVIVGAAEQRLALLVNDVIAQQELVAKALGRPLKHVRNVAGAALLGSGEPVIILNPAELIESAKSVDMTAMPGLRRDSAQAGDAAAAHILVVDDSITTRTLEKNILETAGYRVSTATNGEEALERLKAHPIDLIVSDVKMQPIDGIEFTRHIREDPAYEGMPIILVTSMESREDRERGMQAGADAYIIKRGFDQAELLAAIEQFL